MNSAKSRFFYSGFGNNELIWDIQKQQIQGQIKSMGYKQFDQMSGWKGKEKDKFEAMQQIYVKLIDYGDSAASKITSWLEGGKITPGTISKLNSHNWDEGDSGSNNNSGGNNNNSGNNGSSGSNNGSNSGSNSGSNQNQNGTGQDQNQGNQNWILPAALAGGGLLLLLAMR